MIARAVKTILITQEQLFRATVLVGGRRLLDVLNDGLTEHLQVRDVEVFHDVAMQEMVARFPTACVRKSALSLVIVPQEKHEAPEQRFFSYIQKLQRRAFVAVPGYEVTGQVHLLHPGDALSVLTRELNEFFPVTQAKLRHVSAPNETLEVPVVMVHKPMVSLFWLEEEP